MTIMQELSIAEMCLSSNISGVALINKIQMPRRATGGRNTLVDLWYNDYKHKK